MAILLFIQLFFAIPVQEPVTGVEVSGIIMDAVTNLPIQNVYLYSVKGEEETTSNVKGVFRFITWQAKPVKVFISHRNFKSKVIELRDGFKNLKILMVKK